MKTVQQNSFLAFSAVLLFTVAVSTAGCGGGGDSDTGGTDVVMDTISETGQDVKQDVPKNDTGKDTSIPKDDGQKPKCDPACSYIDYQYCDEGAEQCKELQCTSCFKDSQCGNDGICLHHVFQDGTHASVCSNSCLQDGDCQDGFACDPDSGNCHPLALCKPQPCGDGKLGDACEYNGVNEGCTACDDGLDCRGREPIADTPCKWDAECLSYGIPWQQNPQCVFGQCAYSFCTQPCDESDQCPDGFGASKTLFSCTCVPVGTSLDGEACPIFNVNLEADSCGADLTCIGIESAPDGDPCVTDADCPDSAYFANGQCVDGYCGSSFCCPFCDANEECKVGFGPIDVSGTCFCAPMEFGDGQAGDPCPIFNVNVEADACAHGLTCLGISADEESDACETAADCPIWEYFGNPVCMDGRCGTSFCSPKCDADNECEAGYGPIDVSDKCYCAPREVGDSEAGDPCPIFGVHVDADACTAELICLGIAADEGTLMCTVDADCSPGWYPGSPECIEGRCGTSFCSGKCDGEGNCAEGFESIDVGEKCYCAPAVSGIAVAGDPCPMGNVNTGADFCADELSCLGLAAFEWSQTCVEDGDCPQIGDVTADCFMGYCGGSFCAAECDELGGCLEGALPYLVDGSSCFCFTGLAEGPAAAGEACPFMNVNAAADTCMADLTCLGLVAAPEDDVACTTAADCDPANNPGVADCVNGNCGSSFCAPKCDNEGACEEGFEPFQDEDESCYCAPVAGS